MARTPLPEILSLAKDFVLSATYEIEISRFRLGIDSYDNVSVFQKLSIVGRSVKKTIGTGSNRNRGKI